MAVIIDLDSKSFGGGDLQSIFLTNLAVLNQLQPVKGGYDLSSIYVILLVNSSRSVITKCHGFYLR